MRPRFVLPCLGQVSLMIVMAVMLIAHVCALSAFELPATAATGSDHHQAGEAHVDACDAASGPAAGGVSPAPVSLRGMEATRPTCLAPALFSGGAVGDEPPPPLTRPRLYLLHATLRI